MAYQSVFKRYELKYLLHDSQKAKILEAMEPHMQLDQYGRTTIRNIYFDTDNYRLIRNSIEKPVYKEKLRVRSYRRVNADSPVFVELKKKFDSVVYKRRVSMAEQQAMDWICSRKPGPDTQIGGEIEYFLDFYQTLHPTVFLSYEREAFFCRSGGDFRVTFDDTILCRQDRLSLEYEPGGVALLPEGFTLMEIKTSGGIPLWMTGILSREQIYNASFSKYGTAYQTLIYPNCTGGYLYA